VPHPQLAPFVTGAFDPSLTPTQRSAADAALSSAAARVGNSRVLLLLEARQALAVCLRCWQLQGWRPDPVGALLGVLPHASKALETFAREDAAARKVVSVGLIIMPLATLLAGRMEGIFCGCCRACSAQAVFVTFTVLVCICACFLASACMCAPSGLHRVSEASV
jgi:hypothetical protein